MRILVIEDEEALSDFVVLELRHEGYEAVPVYEGREGLETALNGEWDLVLLDLMLPGLSGIEVCRRLKAAKDTPVIMITARGGVMDRVTGLDTGADDYMPKPFAIEELLARIRVIRRRQEKAGASAPMTLTFKDVELNIESRMARQGDHWIELTKKEYELLFTFMKNVGRVLPRDLLVERIWGHDVGIETNIVDVYVRHVRNKLDTGGDIETYIRTVRGIGYVMRHENE